MEKLGQYRHNTSNKKKHMNVLIDKFMYIFNKHQNCHKKRGSKWGKKIIISPSILDSNFHQRE